ncbi:MAG: hypothetical protein MRZ79_10635 [Bacteroidia bacterium]|nr:hypothetical protein [Bacteroidia bacterium]
MKRELASVSNRNIGLLGLGTYLILGILALVFYKERIAFLDAAYYLFHLIKDSAFNIEHNRWPTIFTQVLPLIARKLNAPLNVVMMTYSLGFIFYFGLIFWLLLVKLKQPALAACLLLFNVLMVADTFYWIQSEFPTGIAFAVLYFGIISRYKEGELVPRWVWMLMMPMLFTSVFFHPLMVLVIGFGAVFFLINHWQDKRIRGLMIESLVAIPIFYLIKSSFFTSAYEKQNMSMLGNFDKYFPNYLAVPSNQEYLSYLIHDFYLLIPLFIWVLVHYGRKKEWLKFSLVLVGVLGYQLLVNVSYADTKFQFHLENQSLPVSFFLLLAWCVDILPSLKPRFSLILLATTLLFQCGHIALRHKKFTQRLNWEREFMAASKGEPVPKLILKESERERKELIMTWATSFEFWLLSTVETGETRSLMVEDNIYNMRWAHGKENTFITKWEVFDYDKLPERYFKFKETGPYEVLEVSTPDTSRLESSDE